MASPWQCLQPTHAQNQHQCREIGLKPFLQLLKNPTQGLEPLVHKCWWRWPLSPAPDLGGKVPFPQSSYVLEISAAENTASLAVCLGDGFYPPGNVSVILLRGRYKINAGMHLSIRYRRTELSAK